MAQKTEKKPAAKKPAAKKPAAKKTAPKKESKTEKPDQKKKINGGARKGSGRPAFVPTDDERSEVLSMAGIGMPYDQICCLIRDGIDKETLAKYFLKELKKGKAIASRKVGQTLYQKAVNDRDTTCLIWWTKSQMRWKETVVNENSNDNTNKNIDMTVNDFAKLRKQVLEIDDV